MSCRPTISVEELYLSLCRQCIKVGFGSVLATLPGIVWAVCEVGGVDNGRKTPEAPAKQMDPFKLTSLPIVKTSSV